MDNTVNWSRHTSSTHLCLKAKNRDSETDQDGNTQTDHHRLGIIVTVRKKRYKTGKTMCINVWDYKTFMTKYEFLSLWKSKQTDKIAQLKPLSMLEYRKTIQTKYACYTQIQTESHRHNHIQPVGYCTWTTSLSDRKETESRMGEMTVNADNVTSTT